LNETDIASIKMDRAGNEGGEGDAVEVTIYAGNAGDRNPRGMAGAVALGQKIAQEFGGFAYLVASPVPVFEGGWLAQLTAATPNLRLLQAQVKARLQRGERLMLTAGRCAASIVTLPLIAQRFPDAAIVWFDAHGDSNAPQDQGMSESSYLGGMVITGAAGIWDTGLGGDALLENVILVGARDLDPPEADRIAAGALKLVPVGPRLGERLQEAIGRRRVYIHLDCDVLAAGLLATEYQSPHGLTFEDLAEGFAVLAEMDVVGLEIAEYENYWPDGRPNCPDRLMASIAPVLEVLKRSLRAA
jgi:arginase